MTIRIPNTVVWVFVVSAAAILVFAVLRYLSGAQSGGRTDYYSLTQLTNSAIASWIPTNPIPLSPDAAVLAAIAHANSNRQQPLSWDIESVELTKLSSESPWFYTINLTDRKSGRYELESIRILMNGEVWVPSRTEK